MARRGEGFGRLYGPNIDPRTGAAFPDDGKIAGTEYLAYADDDDGRQNVAMLVQVPASFRSERPCILAVPVNGSSSLYRDIVDFGYWGLRRDCAVVYTDKGAGNGVHDLETDTVNRLDGTRADAAEAGREAHFRAALDETKRQELLKAFPHRIAFKHAHSKQNPETGWGRDVVRAIQFAFYQLNQDARGSGDGPYLTRDNTLVIATGSSNGGRAALYGGEYDKEGWIDGIVAAEPQVQVQPNNAVMVERGGTKRPGTGRTLLDYFTTAILYQPCAAVATPDAPRREKLAFAENRCRSLKEKGLLSSVTVEAQGNEALAKLRGYGWEPESDVLHASHYDIAPDATAAKYVSDHGRFGVEDRICGLSYAAADKDGRPIPIPADVLATIFATAPGGAPVGPVDIINDLDPAGPRRSAVSASASTGRRDYNLDGALCLRELATGQSANAQRVQAGNREFLASGDLHGKPTIIVHGRADARVPVGFTSRPYLALNSLVEGDRSRLRYVEVANAQHFGASEPGYDTRFVRLTIYHLRALEQMYAHLTQGSPLPDHQVVRPTPRGGQPGQAPSLEPKNIASIAAKPADADRIHVERGRAIIPD
ncbi:D-(-)-3-hydroxybutyrate oligomer hydrolase [Microvirga sp. VF16]|uniref:D-(-)-3-hydroxybutyrate oligomer hydrolase n=1 Tax=Microvirga sp. VF16 TaxID=2807101 RepID=UPI0021125F60|nr:D-(-)-3-hydroxybutyrate oligomer hydrolase [Microvirga sp. VF16]